MGKSNSFIEILNTQFVLIGEWKYENDSLRYEEIKNDAFCVDNTLYSFVEINKFEDKMVRYIGKTTKTLKKRFNGYKNGYGNSTNNNIHNKIKNALSSGSKIEIYALTDTFLLNWGRFKINIAAGLEDSLIQDLEPLWNGGKSETEINESISEKNEVGAKKNNIKTKKLLSESNLSEEDEDERIFSIQLTSTYLNLGYININSNASKLLGKDRDPVSVYFKNQKISETKIDRRANGSSSRVRIYGGKNLVQFYKENNYQLDSFVKFKIISKDRIEII